MSRLIHLNGPSGVGKSTIARRLAAEYPNVIAVDLDAMVAEVPGWRTNFSGALAQAREEAAMIVAACVREGTDVVLAQLVTSFDPLPWGEIIAQRGGASYHEVALLVDADQQRQRVESMTPTDDVSVALQAALLADGGSLMDRVRADFAWYVRERPFTVRIDTSGLTEDETFTAVSTLL